MILMNDSKAEAVNELKPLVDLFKARWYKPLHNGSGNFYISHLNLMKDFANNMKKTSLAFKYKVSDVTVSARLEMVWEIMPIDVPMTKHMAKANRDVLVAECKRLIELVKLADIDSTRPIREKRPPKAKKPINGWEINERVKQVNFKIGGGDDGTIAINEMKMIIGISQGGTYQQLSRFYDVPSSTIQRRIAKRYKAVTGDEFDEEFVTNPENKDVIRLTFEDSISEVKGQVKESEMAELRRQLAEKNSTEPKNTIESSSEEGTVVIDLSKVKPGGGLTATQRRDAIVVPALEKIIATGANTYPDLVEHMNQSNIKSARGGVWTSGSIQHVVKRNDVQGIRLLREIKPKEKVEELPPVVFEPPTVTEIAKTLWQEIKSNVKGFFS